MLKLQILPVPDLDDEIEWRFLDVGQAVADHVFKYISAYCDTYRDAQGELPPSPAACDWEPGRFAWAELQPDLPGNIMITRIGDRWEFGVQVERKPNWETHQWIDVLYVLKKVATMEFK
jgi:hypothetical protein